jgi:formylglycine-generating enzyme required for sulfatase activity
MQTRSEELRAAAIALALVVLLSVPAAAISESGVSNVELSEDDEDIVVTYALMEAQKGYRYEYRVSMTAALTGNDSLKRTIVPRSLSGDYGRGVAPGGSREIRWSILDDAEGPVFGDLDVGLKVDLDRWRWSTTAPKKPGVQLGIEVLTDVWFEYKEKVVWDPYDYEEEFTLTSGGLSLGDNLAYRAFLAIPGKPVSYEIGIMSGSNESPKKIEDYDYDGEFDYDIDYFVVDGRVIVGAFWLGVGIGDLTPEYDYDELEGIIRDDWEPAYWYYELATGLRLGFGRYGALGAEVHWGIQKVGDFEFYDDYYTETATLTLTTTAVRVGYTVKFGDLFAGLGSGGSWERMPSKSYRAGSSLVGLSIGPSPGRYSASNQPDATPEVDGLEFAYIPTGTYWVGTARDESGRDDRYETDPFLIEKQGYFISTTEVPQGTYQQYVNRSWERHAAPDKPAHSVSYDEAVAFCEILSEKDPRFEYSLPTEAEWEIACRGMLHPDQGPICSEDSAAMSRCKQNLGSCVYVLKQHAWFLDNKVGAGAFAVGLKRPNALGLYDMLGNVAEWCQREEEVEKWMSTSESGREPIRGGSILSDFSRCRSGARAWEPRATRKATVGFRVVVRPVN